MLVLSRKCGQRIKLGDSICITVLRVQGDQVRIGIEAPRNVVILRDELEPHELPAPALTEPTSDATLAVNELVLAIAPVMA
jgi:carbon storage regulator